MKFAAGTDKGKHRELNEDCLSIIPGNTDMPSVFVVADGMGGHNSGEIASRAAVDYFSGAIPKVDWGTYADNGFEDELRKLISATNKSVYEKSLEMSENNGMGTTMTAAVVAGETMYIGHVGDSRLYLIREGNLKLLTTDHSYIEEMVRNGSLTREEAKKHPQKHVITRALGCLPEVETDIYSCGIEAGDIYILCTDGLTNMLSEDEIAQIAAANTPEATCEALLQRANDNGGEDNITVIVIKNE